MTLQLWAPRRWRVRVDRGPWYLPEMHGVQLGPVELHWWAPATVEERLRRRIRRATWGVGVCAAVGLVVATLSVWRPW